MEMTSLKDEVVSLADRVKSFPKDTLEIEARIHGVLLNGFQRVVEHFSEKVAPNYVEMTDFYFQGAIRKSYIQEQKGFRVETIEKKSLLHFESKSQDIKFSISKETPVKPISYSPTIIEEKNSVLTRLKKRRQFQLTHTRIDATIVSTISKKGPFNSYEIEIEVNDVSQSSLQELYDVLVEIVKVLYKTDYLISKTTRNTVITDFNDLLQSDPDSRIFLQDDRGIPTLSISVLSNARNLKRKDCVQGSIVGGPYRYTLTDKADGDRTLLFIHTSGLWLLYPRLDINLIVPIQKVRPEQKVVIEALSGTVIDGEEISISKRTIHSPKTKYLYCPFDLMAYKGDISIQKQNHSYRIQMCKEVLNTVSFSDLISFHFKQFIPLESYKSFSPAFETLNLLNPPYHTDGYVITPDNSHYITKDGNIPLYKRTLATVPEICKLKPWEQQTMDFKIQNSNGAISLWMNRVLFVKRSGSTKGEMTEFHGDGWNPFDSKNVIIKANQIDLLTLDDGVIVEFGPIRIDDQIWLEPRRVRKDKPNPNKEDVVMSVWEDINRPLTFEMFKGESFNFLEQHFNTIKKSLFSLIPEGSDLLDIGSGRGGDLSKMIDRKLHRIVCVEPNQDNRNELLRRAAIPMKNGEMIDKIMKVIPSGGEQTEMIVRGVIEHFKWNTTDTKKPLYITMMLSLSFFFGPDGLFEGLIKTFQTIADYYQMPIQFIAFSIEGQRTLQFVNQYPKGQKFTLGKVQLTFTDPNELYIHIPDSIVQHQTEYLVDFDRMFKTLGVQGNVEDIPVQEFMSKYEKQYSSLFVKTNITIPFRPLQFDRILLFNQKVFIGMEIGSDVFECCETVGPVKDLKRKFMKWLQKGKNYQTFMEGGYANENGDLKDVLEQFNDPVSMSTPIFKALPQIVGHSIELYPMWYDEEWKIQFGERYSLNETTIRLSYDGGYSCIGRIKDGVIEWIF